MFDFDLDDIVELGKEVAEGAVNATSALAEKVVEVAKDEAPHIAHKAGEVIEEVVKKIK